jgi:hypothetical protein
MIFRYSVDRALRFSQFSLAAKFQNKERTHTGSTHPPRTTTGYQVMAAMYLSQRRHRIITVVPTATFGF